MESPTVGARESQTWVVVLAAGQGRRLSRLTTDASGRSTPKQFCSLRGARTLLDDALERARTLTEPERTLVVVSAEHREHWSALRERLPAGNVLVQPRDRGTTAGLLLPLHTLLARDPRARVAILPSDHHVARERVLASALRRALSECGTDPRAVILLGIAPDAPDTELGWIQPLPGRWVLRGVERFVEKPPAATARELLAQEAVWNSFLMVGAAQAFRELCARRLPHVAHAFACSFAGPREPGEAELERLYDAIPSADLSHEVLQGSEPYLRVLLTPPCGWSDLGTPARVAACLSRSPAREPDAPQRALRLDAALERLGSAAFAPSA
jgi:mannose-1-phosphate guanylyltransferase